MSTEPVRGGFFVREAMGLSGREQMARAISGELPAPPIHHLTGMRPTEIGDGTSEFTMPASGWLTGPFGLIPGGMLAVLADGPLGASIQSTLPPYVHYTTAELSMSYLRPGPPDGRLLTSTGRAIHVGRTLALSDATVADAGGRQLAHCTSRCLVFPPVPPGDAPAPEPLPAATPDGTPDPWQREPAGELADPDRLAAMTGLEQWQAWAAGDLPPPPIAHLSGAHPVAVSAGRVEWAMPATGWLCSPTGFVEGGFLAYLADSAIVTAAATVAPAGTAYSPVDVTVKFLRPARPDGRDLVAHGRVVHAGRTLVVAAADVRNADGKMMATAVGSVLLSAPR